MSITLQPLMAGSAFRIFVVPPSNYVWPLIADGFWTANGEQIADGVYGSTTTLYRLLRRTTDDFSGHNDPGALLIHEGNAHVLMDTDGLVNGTAYHYRLYVWNGYAWSDAGGAVGTPAATYHDESTDVLAIVRDRIAAGLVAEVSAGRLSHPKGRIPVRTAPPQDKDETLPLVTLQLSSDSPADRAIGEDLIGYEDGDFEGWLSDVRLELMGWSWNPDERNELRRALKRIVLANLAVFDAAGMVQINFTQRDTEDFSTYTAPMYQTMGEFNCLAPSAVTGGDYGVIADISVAAIPINP